MATDAVRFTDIDQARKIRAYSFTGDPSVELPNAVVGCEATDYVTGVLYKKLSSGGWTALGGGLSQTTADARYVQLTGGIMSGPLQNTGAGAFTIGSVASKARIMYGQSASYSFSMLTELNGYADLYMHNLVASGTLKTGTSGSGTGGQVDYIDDGGTLRWAAGILGTVGARDFVVYDNANATSVLTISASSHVATFASDVWGYDLHAVRSSATGVMYLGSDGAGYVYRSATGVMNFVANGTTLAVMTAGAGIDVNGYLYSYSGVLYLGSTSHSLSLSGSNIVSNSVTQVAVNATAAYAFQVYQDSTTGYGITTRVASDAYYAFGVNNAANTATTFYIGGDGRVVASNYVLATAGFIGAYNPSYRRRLYAMGSAYAGSADTSGNLYDLTGYYGLTFAYDTTAGGGYPDITGKTLGHGVELLSNGVHCGMWGTNGFYLPTQMYAAGLTTTGDLSVGGEAYVQGFHVAKVLISSVSPTTSDLAPYGTLWFNKTTA